MKKAEPYKGFTLIELIVTLAIITLVMSGVFSLLLFNQKVYGKGSSQYDIQSNMRLAASSISQELRYATQIEILDSSAAVPATPDAMDANEGYIYYDSSNGTISKLSKTSPFSIEIGKASGSGITFSHEADSSTVMFNIDAKDKDKNYSLSTKTLCLNLQLEGSAVSGVLSGNAAHYFKDLTYSDSIGGPISDLSAVAGDQVVYLSFSKPVGATRIILSRSLSEAGIYSQIGVLDASNSNYADTGLTNGTTYYYKLNIEGGTNQGESNIAYATPNISGGIYAVDMNVKEKTLSGTTAGMQYALNRDVSGNGSTPWINCAQNITENISFEKGYVWVREKDESDISKWFKVGEVKEAIPVQKYKEKGKDHFRKNDMSTILKKDGYLYNLNNNGNNPLDSTVSFNLNKHDTLVITREATKDTLGYIVTNPD
jgi:prepilin-type N-terminal cleavage/methylation domain-containing protein